MPSFCTTLGVAVLGTYVAKTGQRPSPDRPGRSWLQTEVSAEAAPCRAATGLRPTCTRRRGEDPQHLPPRHTRPHRARYPVMYTPLRERTRLPPEGSGFSQGFSVPLCLRSAHVSLCVGVFVHTRPRCVLPLKCLCAACACMYVVCVHTCRGACQLQAWRSLGPNPAGQRASPTPRPEAGSAGARPQVPLASPLAQGGDVCPPPGFCECREGTDARALRLSVAT